MRERIDWADVVVCHAGVGITLNCLEAGKSPVIVPREGPEHVDEHQTEFADAMSRGGLAVVRRVHQLELADLETARSRHTSSSGVSKLDFERLIGPTPAA
jgi:UDP-N-acetylglucosamine transferase subunit ALG13